MDSQRSLLLNPNDNARQTKQVPKSQHKVLMNKYFVMREIGHGSQGKVFLANDLDSNALVVVKQLNISSIKTWKEYELFHRESEVLRTLDIDGIAKFYDGIECLDDDPPCSYIVQEYIKGVSLQKMIDDGHRFTINDVYDILIQLLEIVDKLQKHDPPIIHRDIKPSNLMITFENGKGMKVTVIDFGAVANPQLKGGGSTVAGTFGYMPPEQLTGKPCPASDIYAIGALAVQLLCGKSPADIPSKGFRLIFEPLIQDKPHELVSLLGRMLEPKTEERLADIKEIIESFKKFRAGNYKDSGAQKSDRASNHAYASEYEQDLEDVVFFGDPENMKLWQRLPDQTPRAIPGIYHSYLKKLITPIPKVPEQPKETSFWTQRRRKYESKYNFYHWIFNIPSTSGEWAAFVAGWLFLVVLVILALSFILMIALNSHQIFNISMYFLVATFILYIIYCVTSSIVELSDSSSEFYKAWNNDNHLSQSPENSNSNTSGSDLKANYDIIANCIINGRKSIATIHDIQYLPLKTCVQNKNLLICDDPTFVIKYTFNPPDDKRKEDLIHLFYTHTDPNQFLKIGEPIPILYYIDNHYFYDEVHSIPYPFVLNDYKKIDQYLGSSSSERTSIQSYSNETANDIIKQFKQTNSLMEKKFILNQINTKRFDDQNRDILYKFIQTVLLDNKQATLHDICVTSIINLYGLGSQDSHDETYYAIRADEIKCVSNAFAKYLNHEPKSIFPSIWGLNEILSTCENCLNMCTFFCKDFWFALANVYKSPDAPTKVKQAIKSFSDRNPILSTLRNMMYGDDIHSDLI